MFSINFKKSMVLLSVFIMIALSMLDTSSIFAKDLDNTIQPSSNCGGQTVPVDYLFHWSRYYWAEIVVPWPNDDWRFIRHYYRGYRWYAIPPGFQATNEYMECDTPPYYVGWPA